MERNKLIGLMICVILVLSGFAVNGNVGLYFNLAALLIVLGGTFGAARLGSTSVADIERIKNVAGRVCLHRL